MQIKEVSQPEYILPIKFLSKTGKEISLYNILGAFANRNINLTKLESRPGKERPWEYVFYVDFEGHINDDICKDALEDIKDKTSFIKILGSYPRAKD